MSTPKPRRAAVPGVQVYQRGKTWTYRLELEPDELTGERRFDYKGGFATEAEAWTAGITANAEEVQNRRVPPSTRSVAAFFTEWLAAIEHSVKPTTHTNYLDYLSAYVLPAIGKRRLQDVTVPMLNELYRRLLTHGRVKPDNNMRMYEYWLKHEAKRVVKPAEVAHACGTTIHAARSAVYRFRRGRVPIARSAGLAPKTVKNVHRMLHRAFSDAVAWRYIAYNPAVHASLPRMRLSESGGRKGATWTPEQLAAWLRLAVDDRFAGLWVLVATTGMRRSELAGVERRLIEAYTLQIYTHRSHGRDRVAADQVACKIFDGFQD